MRLDFKAGWVCAQQGDEMRLILDGFLYINGNKDMYQAMGLHRSVHYACLLW